MGRLFVRHFMQPVGLRRIMAALDVALTEFRQHDAALTVPEIRARSMLTVIRREISEMLGRELEANKDRAPSSSDSRG